MIQAFFNPQHPGDTFRGLNGTIQGRTADRLIQGLPEFLQAAERDYWIRKAPAGVLLSDGTYGPADGQYHLVRAREGSPDGLIVSPMTVREQYAPLSLLDVAEELRPWTEQGWATPDGVYDRNLSTEILSLRLDGGDMDAFKGPDRMLHYAIVILRHGQGRAEGKIISWRMVCQNTIAAACSAAADFKIGHRTASDADKAETMRERTALAVNGWEALRTHVRSLAERMDAFKAVDLTPSKAERIVERILGIKAGRASRQAENRKAEILDAFNDPRYGTEGRTLWDLYNGVTFTLSSPYARLARGKSDPLDRMVRSIDFRQGVNFRAESRAVEILAGVAAK